MAIFPGFNSKPSEDASVGLLRDELSQANVKLLQLTEANAKLRAQLANAERDEALLQVRVNSFRKGIEVLERAAIEANAKVGTLAI